jgi:hypothetical protein
MRAGALAKANPSGGGGAKPRDPSLIGGEEGRPGCLEDRWMPGPRGLENGLAIH